ncbi:MAG TPA: hypothetical protein VF297_18250 [Pyrinomonadaceae bacterium]
MKKRRRTALRLLLLFTLLPACGPRARGAQERRAPQTKTKQTPKAARDAKERERRERQQAAVVVGEAVAAAPEVKDSYKRAMLLALAADALWTFDEQAARSLFARAWETAVASDAEETLAFKKRVSEGGPDVSPWDADEAAFTNVVGARQEVLAAASRRDARLTERYLAEFGKSIEPNGADAPADEDERLPGNFRGYANGILENENLGAAERMRLDLSRTLAEAGDYRQAAMVAASAVAGGVNAALIQFLVGLRRDAPAEADALYRQLLARTAADPRAGVNDVLLLSTYALTPGVLVLVDESGSVGFSGLQLAGNDGSNNATTTPVPRAVRMDFFNAAATVLPRAGARRTAGTDEARRRATALFFAATRLLPFFEREAPQFAPQLHALRQSAGAELGAASRDSLSQTAGRSSITPSNPVDPLKDDLEYAKRGPHATARDAARQRALREAVRLKLWDRAREAIAGMEDVDLRADSLNELAVCQVAAVGESFDGDEDGDERAARFVEQANVPPLTRALGYARAALLASKLKKQARVTELIELARDYAERTDGGREERFVALLVVATAAEQADPARAWALLPALVRAANETSDAPADELGGGFRTPRLEGAENVCVAEQLADFRLDKLFAALARRDSARALREARALMDVTTRSLVTVSAARAALERRADKSR